MKAIRQEFLGSFLNLVRKQFLYVQKTEIYNIFEKLNLTFQISCCMIKLRFHRIKGPILINVTKLLMTALPFLSPTTLHPPPPLLPCFLDGWMDGWMDGWLDGWIDGWMDGWMEVDQNKLGLQCGNSIFIVELCNKNRQ